MSYNIEYIFEYKFLYIEFKNVSLPYIVDRYYPCV